MKRERTLPGKTLRVLTALLLICATLTAMTLPAFAIELKTGIGIVETSGLRLRAKPNTDCEILANASYGDSVVIIRDAGDFYLVDYNLQIGYMAKQYITFKERENIELGYANVIDSAVNMRSAPSSDGELLAQLTPGDQPYIIGFNCGWYKVTFGGDTGYIRSDLLELTQAPVGLLQGLTQSAPAHRSTACGSREGLSTTSPRGTFTTPSRSTNPSGRRARAASTGHLPPRAARGYELTWLAATARSAQVRASKSERPLGRMRRSSEWLRSQAPFRPGASGSQ